MGAFANFIPDGFKFTFSRSSHPLQNIVDCCRRGRDAILGLEKSWHFAHHAAHEYLEEDYQCKEGYAKPPFLRAGFVLCDGFHSAAVAEIDGKEKTDEPDWKRVWDFFDVLVLGANHFNIC